jgi:alpha-beta hydrolase superfamily lysophospholipase
MIRRRVAVSTLGAALLEIGLGTAGRAAAAPLPPPDMTFRMRDGFVLPARVWTPPSGTGTDGIILALHGFTDSRDAWELPAPVFAASGYLVVAPDQRGFGATADRGIWAGETTLVDDAAELAARLRARFPGHRLVVMGESMGGAVTMCLAARAPEAADAFILCSPAVWGRAEMPAGLRGALWAADLVAPGWRLTGQEVPLEIAACDNRDALIRLAHNPLTLRSVSVDMLRGLVDLMDAAQHAAGRLPAHTLILNGRRDMVVPLHATATAWAKLPQDVRRGLYLNGYHLLLRDLDRALVEADILAWLEDPAAWLPSGADVNAAAWLADQAGVTAVPGALPAQLLDGAGQRRVWPF